MRMFESSVYVVYVFVFVGCASPKMASTSSAGYSEDLSALRPAIEVKKDTVIAKSGEEKTNKAYIEPKVAITPALDAVLDSIDAINLSRNYVEGFTIQVYSGRREEALNTRKQLTSLLPEIESEVQFTEPIFRVKAGRYFSWIEAQRDFTLIKKYFPSAIIIPDRIVVAQED